MARSPRASQRDATAREAARLLARGEAPDIDHALRMAGESSGNQQSLRPSRLQVRRHAQAMAMQAMGETEYLQQHRDWLMLAEEVMATIGQAFPDARTLLAGRAAEGKFDADPVLHLRVHTDASMTDLARSLVEFGYPEPQFTTLESRVGRLSQMQWIEAGARIVITRCPQSSVFELKTDLATGKPVATLTPAQLGERLK